MFQLDQPELDFGLCRIMHAKAEQIQAFLDTNLTEQIDQALAQAVEFGIADPDNNPGLKDAKCAYAKIQTCRNYSKLST